MFYLEAEGLSCGLDILYRGQEISKLQFVIKAKQNKNFQL